MDLLKQAADSFIKLKEIEYRIILSAGRKRPLEIIELNFCDSDFFHILGLQYLKDIDLPKAKTKLFTEINKGSLSEEYIAKSQFFDNLQLGYSIKQRIEMAINIEQYMDSDDFNVAIYSSSRNTRDFSREIRAQSEACLHREYNLTMKNKSLRRIADVRSGRRLRAAHVAARTPRRS